MNEIENTPQAWSLRAAEASSSWGAAGWSERGQVQRFRAALRHLELRPGDLLLDYGCGDGALSAHVPAGVRYFGFDTAFGMLDRAHRLRPEGIFRNSIAPGAEFDHIVCIGPFNLPGSREETWATLERLWNEHTRRTLVASLYDGTDDRCLTYDASWALGLAKSLSDSYLIDHSYLPNDVLMVVWK